jgi:hypothetical protein
MPMPMSSDRAIRRYRRWYRRLLRLYPRPFRDRFAEPMTQTFTDLARERADADRGLLGFAIGAFLETSVQIMRENMTHYSSTRQLPDAPRPTTVTVLAVLASIGGVGAVIGVLAGAFLVHGLASLDAGDAVIVTPGIALAAVYLAFARGAWALRPWGWTMGVVAGVGTVVYLAAILAAGWADFMRDAPPLAWISLVAILIGGAGLLLWFRPGVRAAFDRD